ncbi:unnamed protein product [Bursaphelenchus xylophilus]|uniref:(pine wood nematode) hypothetical protein n=1 Tax=Bursaphelenchus xylophilus TaxID=6326 RepID=A0A7I8X7M3_BURXY|nr:unnamed protein product [Bursaphelenchus xylophilus]CAG9125945.1 unnamed protein product [Bursaphelenchus xylophilus]
MGTWLNRVTCTFFRHPQHLPPSPTPPILYPSPSYHPTAPSTHEHPPSSRPHHQQHCTPPQDNNQLTALLANLLANTINNQSPYHRGRRGGRGRHYPRGGIWKRRSEEGHLELLSAKIRKLNTEQKDELIIEGNDHKAHRKQISARDSTRDGDNHMSTDNFTLRSKTSIQPEHNTFE